MFWLFHIWNNAAKQTAKLTVPFMVSSRSSNDFGTSTDTMISVKAKAKTASLKVSSRDGSWLRQTMLLDPLLNFAAFCRIIST